MIQTKKWVYRCVLIVASLLQYLSFTLILCCPVLTKIESILIEAFISIFRCVDDLHNIDSDYFDQMVDIFFKKYFSWIKVRPQIHRPRFWI